MKALVFVLLIAVCAGCSGQGGAALLPMPIAHRATAPATFNAGAAQ